jgi:hypothetical protein
VSNVLFGNTLSHDGHTGMPAPTVAEHDEHWIMSGAIVALYCPIY